MTQSLKDMLEPITAEVVYSPPPVSQRKPATPIYLHVLDDRRSQRLAQNSDIADPVLNNVSFVIAKPGNPSIQDSRTANIPPAQVAQRALAARINSLGFPAHIDATAAGAGAKELVLYLYGFDVQYESERACVASVALALGKPSPLPGASTVPSLTARQMTHPGNPFVVMPVPPSPTEEPVPEHLLFLAPVCAQSVGLGTAQVVVGKASDAAGTALSRALQQATDNLNFRECLR